MNRYIHIIRSFLLCILCSGITMALTAQVTVQFMPVVYGQTLEGLAYAQIINSSGSDLMGSLTIRVREQKGGQVVTIKTAAFIVHPGANAIDRRAFGSAKISFGNNNNGLTLSQTGRFPEGDYEYCFELDLSQSKNPQVSPVAENCFVHQLQPMTPLLLIDPVDGDEFCNKRPNFTWQPPVPLPREARHRLVLTPIREKQDPVEAVTYNQPVINQGNIPGNNLFYPPNAPDLKEGQQYGWQVIVYTAKSILARSEVWTFTVRCNTDQPMVDGNSYRELKETDDGNFYVASRMLSFSLYNPYAEGDLNYSIINLADPSQPVKKLPVLKLKSGLNKYDLDLSEIRAFKNDQEYLLKVQLQNSRVLALRFIYKEE